MARHVFRYSHSRSLIGVRFVAWLGVLALYVLRSDTEVSHVGTIWFAIDYVAITLNLAILAYLKHCRIEIDGDRIRWFDWLGRKIVDGSMEGVHLLPPPPYITSARQIQTDRGRITIRTELMPYRDELISIIGSVVTTNEHPDHGEFSLRR